MSTSLISQIGIEQITNDDNDWLEIETDSNASRKQRRGSFNAATVTNGVYTSGDQSIGGIKTFSSFPVTPSSAPSSNYEVANKKYVDDTAGSATYATYQSASGTANDWTQSFQQTPAHTTSFREMSAGGPAGSWWFVENMRHSNGTNYWGKQIAHGWEDNANVTYIRNWQGGVAGAWVKQITSNDIGQIYHVQEQQAVNVAGHAGATFTAGWSQRILNTIVTNTISGASLSNNIITLPAGKYIGDITIPCYMVNNTTAKLVDYNTAVQVLLGTVEQANASANDPATVHIRGVFTLSAAANLYITQYAQTQKTANGFGVACVSGTGIFTDAFFTKIA